MDTIEHVELSVGVSTDKYIELEEQIEEKKGEISDIDSELKVMKAEIVEYEKKCAEMQEYSTLYFADISNKCLLKHQMGLMMKDRESKSKEVSQLLVEKRELSKKLRVQARHLFELEKGKKIGNHDTSLVKVDVSNTLIRNTKKVVETEKDKINRPVRNMKSVRSGDASSHQVPCNVTSPPLDPVRKDREKRVSFHANVTSVSMTWPVDRSHTKKLPTCTFVPSQANNQSCNQIGMLSASTSVDSNTSRESRIAGSSQGQCSTSRIAGSSQGQCSTSGVVGVKVGTYSAKCNVLSSHESKKQLVKKDIAKLEQKDQSSAMVKLDRKNVDIDPLIQSFMEEDDDILMGFVAKLENGKQEKQEPKESRPNSGEDVPNFDLLVQDFLEEDDAYMNHLADSEPNLSDVVQKQEDENVWEGDDDIFFQIDC